MKAPGVINLLPITGMNLAHSSAVIPLRLISHVKLWQLVQVNSMLRISLSSPNADMYSAVEISEGLQLAFKLNVTSAAPSPISLSTDFDPYPYAVAQIL